MSFLISAVFTFFVRKGIVVVNDFSNNRMPNILKDLKAGVSYLAGAKPVIGLAVLFSFLHITLYTTNVLLSAFAQVDLAVGAEGYGIIDAAWAAGAIVGGTTLLTIIRKIGEYYFIKFGLFFVASAVIFFSMSSGLVQAAVGYFLIGFTVVLIRIAYDTKIQVAVDTSFQGRVKSIIIMGISVIGLFVYGIVGLLGDLFTVRFLYFGLAGVLLIGGLLAISISRLFYSKGRVDAPSVELNK